MSECGYPLSFGPACWLSDRYYPGILSEAQSHALIEVVDFIYAPLDWIRDQSPWFDEIYGLYMSLWGYSRASDVSGVTVPGNG